MRKENERWPSILLFGTHMDLGGERSGLMGVGHRSDTDRRGEKTGAEATAGTLQQD